MNENVPISEDVNMSNRMCKYNVVVLAKRLMRLEDTVIWALREIEKIAGKEGSGGFREFEKKVYAVRHRLEKIEANLEEGEQKHCEAEQKRERILSEMVVERLMAKKGTLHD